MRDEFTQQVKEQIAKRVGNRCSKPDCRQQTSGPQTAAAGVANIGVAAHITAASPGGPRYDNQLSSDDRRSAANAIWLCQNCAKLIDADVPGHPEALLREWKEIAEATALLELKGRMVVPDRRGVLERLEADLPELFAEMRDDLKEHPFHREFILMKRGLRYNSGGKVVLTYYFDDHPDLIEKVRMLENHNLVVNSTYNNVDRFRISEELVEYLK